MSKKSLAAVSLVVLALAGCGRDGPPAPVEVRGINTGETSPSMARADTYTTPTSTETSSYTPPPGYGGTPAATPSYNSSVQTQTLGEPNDPYAQAAQQHPTPSNINMNPPPPNAGVAPSMNTSNDSVRASQVGQPQVLGTMPENTPVTSGVPVTSTTTTTTATTTTRTPSAPIAPTASESLDQGSGAFGWPLRGRIISGFGPKDGGQANDGLNIASPLGTSVYAAKEGTVAYAGNELRSFGNMVLVRHTGGMFTVYAHLDQIQVAKDAPITKGQQVGTVGQSGGVSEPQLHFEVRRGSTPQDPMKYLSR